MTGIQKSNLNYSHLPPALVLMSLTVVSAILIQVKAPLAILIFPPSIAAFMIYLFPVIPVRLFAKKRLSRRMLWRPIMFAICFLIFSSVLFFRQYLLLPAWIETAGLLAGAGFFLFETPTIIRNFDKWQFKTYLFVGIAYLSMWSWL
ncbi:hypothetical protein [Halocola ammonii]